MSQNKAIIEEFIFETNESLSSIGQELTQFESDTTNVEILNEVYRKVHTMKGSANFLGFKKLQKITHILENILDLVREHKIEVNSNLTDLLLKGFDSCQVIVKNIEENETEGEGNFDTLRLQLLSFLESILQEKNFSLDDTQLNLTSSIQLKKPDISQLEKKSEEVDNKQKEKASLNIVKETVENINLSTQSTPKQKKDSEIKMELEKELTEDAANKNVSNKSADSYVRVHVSLLDKIMNIVGELVLNRNQIMQYMNDCQEYELQKLSHKLNIITSELQNQIMNTRMQPVGNVINKFERVIRDLAKTQGKKITLHISGQDTELDKTLLESVKDPLTHLVRNCVDHGIEAPSVREARGKPEMASINIRAYHEGGQVAIEISDDGAGIDPQKILNKAIEKSIITQEQAAQFSEQKILNLIFTPGFSTAEKVTNISGRGVGMDVVKSNIEKIGGSVHINSHLGEGSSFKLKIPLTLAIIPALHVCAEGENFAIAQSNLIELVRIEEENLHQSIETIKGTQLLRLRGEIIPLLNLKKSLNLEVLHESSLRINAQFEEGIEKISAHKNTVTNIVVLNADGQIYGLIVDEILDTEEIVVKPLSSKVKEISAFAGAAILGNGKVTLIIDVVGFLNTFGHYHDEKSETKTFTLKQGLQISGNLQQEYLIFTLQDKRKYALPLVLVDRLEEIDSRKVEFTGKQPIYHYRNKPMPLILLEDFIATDAKPISLSQNDNKLKCIVVTINKLSYGIIVDEIFDISKNQDEINSDASKIDGVLGTIFIDDRAVTVLDFYRVVELKTGIKPFEHSRYSRQKVLLAEDSAIFRKLITDLLLEINLTPVIAHNGKEALDILKENKDIKLVISDIEMPVMDGFELGEAIRENESLKNVKLIALTSKVKESDLQKTKEIGFDYHLEKFKKDIIIEKIDIIAKEGSL